MDTVTESGMAIAMAVRRLTFVTLLYVQYLSVLRLTSPSLA